MLYRKIDDSGLFVEDVIIDNVPSDKNGDPDSHYIATPCPGGFYWPRRDGAQWVEGRTAAEIAAIKASAVPAEPTDKERIDLLISENVALKARLAKIEAVPIVKTTLEPIVIKEPIISK